MLKFLFVLEAIRAYFSDMIESVNSQGASGPTYLVLACYPRAFADLCAPTEANIIFETLISEYELVSFQS